MRKIISQFQTLSNLLNLFFSFFPSFVLTLLPNKHVQQCTIAEFLKVRSMNICTDRSEDLSVAEDIDMRDGRDESEIVGGAIHFCLNDTPFCFVNARVGKKIIGRLKRDNYYLHLRSNMDLDTCFHHSFLIGRPLEELYDQLSPYSKYWVRWNDAFQTPTGAETVMYRSLTPNPTSELRCSATAEKGYSEVSFMYSLPPLSPEQRGVLHSKVLIKLSSLCCS